MSPSDDAHPKDGAAGQAPAASASDEPLSEKDAQRLSLPAALPVIPSREVVVYPTMLVPLLVPGEPEKRAVNEALVKDRLLAVVAQKDPENEQPGPDDMYAVGTAVKVLKMVKFPDGTARILVQGLARIRTARYVRTEPFLLAEIERLESTIPEDVAVRALGQSVTDQFQKMVTLSPQLPEELKIAVLNIDNLSRLADMVVTTLHLTLEQGQDVLETLNVGERLEKVQRFLSQQLELLELSSKIQSQVKSEAEKTQREYFLRQQLKALQEELGETDERTAEINELRKRLEEARLPEEASKEAHRELDRLAKMPPAAAEYTVARTYLDWIIALPWSKSTRDRLDIEKAEAILNEDHYDLDRVKQRVLEYLAVRKLKKDTKGPILCFVGPPGTGKTSLGRSIARALRRKFVRISLGGVRDEAEIRGHRRTYVGALPGRIIQGLRKAGTRNPVFMLDEIDKLGADFRGDPSAALLEVLDPEQNFSFADHYLDVPFDLSSVMFITTANILDPIPPALRDRMETLELPGYTDEDKLAIARQYLVPRQLAAHGLKPRHVEFDPDAILAIARSYTREAGLRSLEREIAAVCRKVAAALARNPKEFKQRRIASADLADLLGPARFYPEVAQRTSDPGVATGLAWTQAGGEILFLESTGMPGNGLLILTGRLGDVMKESAQAALSYVRSRADALGLAKDVFRKSDLHVHVPAGAIAKDGPSAGVTIAMSLISLLLDKPVKANVAMTGEITLRGRVLPIGGVKEKALAARRAGIDTVVLPKQNEKDISEVPENVRDGMHFHFVEKVDEMLPLVFDDPPVLQLDADEGVRSSGPTPVEQETRPGGEKKAARGR